MGARVLSKLAQNINAVLCLRPRSPRPFTYYQNRQPTLPRKVEFGSFGMSGAAKFVGGENGEVMEPSFSMLENDDFVSPSVKASAVGWAVGAVTMVVVLTVCF